MIKYLHVRNLALVEEADIEFEPGFNAVTGETGAGKSVIMGGLGLLLGGRFDKSAIRQGEQRCEVCGEFSVPDSLLPELSALFDSVGLEPVSGGSVFIRRVFTPSSGRIFINSSPATLQTLKTLGGFLADVHSAGEACGLVKPSAQLAALDRFAGLSALLTSCREAWDARKNAEQKRLDFLQTRPSASEAEELTARLNEIDKADPEPDEDVRLETTHSAAANAKEILETASAAVSALSESDNSLVDSLSQVLRLIQSMERTDPEYAEKFASRCETLSDELMELSNDISDRARSIELDEAEFTALEERMSMLQTLKRKYGPTLKNVMEYRDKGRERLLLFENSEAELKKLEADLASAVRKHTELCRELSLKRKAAAEGLSAKLKKEIIKLGFKRAEFRVAFQVAEPGRNGSDRIEFEFSANPGVPVKPLASVASSGELSRVMLAVKTVLAEADDIPTLVFDEIDANIGGETAVTVADELAELAKNKQIISISHLAQVAARANTHFRVLKVTTDEKAVSTVSRLDAKGRRLEIARMLGGGTAADQHAKHLLEH